MIASSLSKYLTAPQYKNPFAQLLLRAQFRHGSVNPVASTGFRFHHAFLPRLPRAKKQKGRVPVRTGGSSKGTSLVYGGTGMRLKDDGKRFTSKQLQQAENIIRKNIPKGSKIYCRVACSISVCTKGNESRMGRGKGSFEYWAARVPVSKVLFEIDKNVRPEQAKKALKFAAAKLPGHWELIDVTAKPKAGLIDIDKIDQRSLMTNPHAARTVAVAVAAINAKNMATGITAAEKLA